VPAPGLQAVSPLLLNLLACPYDRGELAEAGEALRCHSCGREFPIDGGIPSFVVPEELAAEQRDEKTSRDHSAATYEAEFADRVNRLEIETLTRWFRPAVDSVCVEVGCGTGRITRQYTSRGVTVVGIDFALETLRQHRRLDPQALLVHADCTRLPFRDDAFDAGLSVQVYEHLPTADLRERGFSELGRVVKPCGPMLVSVYHYSVLKRLWAWLTLGKRIRMDGHHRVVQDDFVGQIYYHHLTAREIRELASSCMRVDQVRGYQTVGLRRYPLESLEYVAQRTPLGLLTSELVAAIGGAQPCPG
jgi:SAM-dependent methyltransferase